MAKILKRCLDWILKGVLKSLGGGVVICICICIIGYLLSLSPARLGVDYKASFFKALEAIVVLKKVEKLPDVQLLSQYPYEYNLPDGRIKKGEVLEISKENKPLWLSIFNAESRTLNDVRFILFPDNEVKIFNEHEWKNSWIIAQFGQEKTTQYEYKFPARISPETGWVIPEPIQLEFPLIKEFQDLVV